MVVGSHIGYGSPMQDDAGAHGSPLGEEALDAARERLGWPHAPFEVPNEVHAYWRAGARHQAVARTRWDERFSAYR